MQFLKILASLSCFLPSFLFAIWGNFTAPEGTIDITGDTPALLIARIIRYGIVIAGILGIIGVTWWGIQMITSAWEDEKFKKSRYMIIFSLIGVWVAGLAYWVVGLISWLRF